MSTKPFGKLRRQEISQNCDSERPKSPVSFLADHGHAFAGQITKEHQEEVSPLLSQKRLKFSVEKGHGAKVPSCDACRKKHLKCDRKFPSCDRCVDAKIPCHYKVKKKNSSGVPGYGVGGTSTPEGTPDISQLQLTDFDPRNFCGETTYNVVQSDPMRRIANTSPFETLSFSSSTPSAPQVSSHLSPILPTTRSYSQPAYLLSQLQSPSSPNQSPSSVSSLPSSSISPSPTPLSPNSFLPHLFSQQSLHDGDEGGVSVTRSKGGPIHLPPPVPSLGKTRNHQEIMKPSLYGICDDLGWTKTVTGQKDLLDLPVDLEQEKRLEQMLTQIVLESSLPSALVAVQWKQVPSGLQLCPPGMVARNDSFFSLFNKDAEVYADSIHPMSVRGSMQQCLKDAIGIPMSQSVAYMPMIIFDGQQWREYNTRCFQIYDGRGLLRFVRREMFPPTTEPLLPRPETRIERGFRVSSPLERTPAELLIAPCPTENLSLDQERGKKRRKTFEEQFDEFESPSPPKYLFLEQDRGKKRRRTFED